MVASYKECTRLSSESIGVQLDDNGFPNQAFNRRYASKVSDDQTARMHG